MSFAVDIMHGCGPSNKMHHQLQPKKINIKLYWLLMQKKASHVPCTLSTKQSMVLAVDIM